MALRLFCFVFIFLLSHEIRGPLFNRSSKYMRPDSHTQLLPKNCMCLFCFLFICCFLGDVAFPEYYVALSFPPCMESTLNVFFPDDIFLPCDHELGFLHQLM